MPETGEHTTNEIDADAERNCNSLAANAADKIRAAIDVLRAVQRFRYEDEHPYVREVMRQTAIAALESAEADAFEEWVSE